MLGSGAAFDVHSSRPKNVDEPDPSVPDLDLKPRHRLEDLLGKPSHAFDQRADDLFRLLTIVDSHQVIDAFGVETIRPGEELDAVSIRIVNRGRLELLGWPRQQHHALGEFAVGHRAHKWHRQPYPQRSSSSSLRIPSKMAVGLCKIIGTIMPHSLA